jgi:addiction module RelE/StbE family toxin
MEIILSKIFLKRYNKLRLSEKKRFKERRCIFLNDSKDPILNNHALHGKYMGYRSISITGNIRVIYRFLDKDTVIFSEIGTHSKLYS